MSPRAQVLSLENCAAAAGSAFGFQDTDWGLPRPPARRWWRGHHMGLVAALALVLVLI